MTKMLFIQVPLAVFVACFPPDLLPADPPSVDPQDLEMKVELTSRSPYPCQAVRLRLTIRNVSDKRLGPIAPAENVVGGLLLKGPDDVRYRGLQNAIVLRDMDHPTDGSYREHMNERAPVFLDPGEQTSVSFAFAAEWKVERRMARGKEIYAPAGKAIFSKSGEYSLKCSYGVDLQRKVQIEKIIAIEVGKAKGDDEVVYDLLEKDPGLASVVMSPVYVAENALLAPKLKEIVDRFPNSSYADYARFALARAYMRGTGASSGRIGMAMAADELEKISWVRYDRQTTKLVASEFPYVPSALILLKTADPLAKKNALLRLHREFPDSLEWIEEYARLLTTLDERSMAEVEMVTGHKAPTRADDLAKEWQSFRKRRPVDPNEKPPGK